MDKVKVEPRQEPDCLICSQPKHRHAQIVGAGLVCPVSAVTYRPKPVESQHLTPAGDDVVERVAKAIHDARYGSDYPVKLRMEFDHEYKDGQEYCRRLARAAIAAGASHFADVALADAHAKYQALYDEKIAALGSTRAVEDMRERAARLCDDLEHFARCGSISWSAAEPDKLAAKAEAAEQLAKAIRSLPIEGERG